jgi:hypothetical protein
MTTESKTKLYLGDGVYLDSQRPDALILTTEADAEVVTNRIVLESEVVLNLLTILRVDVPKWLQERLDGGDATWRLNTTPKH